MADVRLHIFDKSARPVADLSELERTVPAGAVTDLAAAINAIAAERPKAALGLLISDGIHNAPSDLQAAARAVRAAGIPVFTSALGSNIAVKDFGVVLSSSEELAFAGQQVCVKDYLAIDRRITKTQFISGLYGAIQH